MQKPGRTSIPNAGVGGGTVYTDAQVLSALASTGSETWAFDRLDASGVYVSDLTPFVVEGSNPTVTHDSTAAVKRTLSIRLSGSAPVLPLSHQIRPRYLFRAPDGGWLEFRLGKFLVNAPSRSVFSGWTWLDYTCVDSSQLLLDTPFLVSTGAPAGSSYIQAVLSVISGYGGTIPIGSLIPDSGSQLPAALGWTVDYSRLAAINDLLGATNYGTLWFDENGLARADTVPDFNLVVPSQTWDTRRGLAPVLPWKEVPDLARAANIFQVIGQDPRRQPVVGTYINSSPLSRVSTVNWHPKVRIIRDSTIPSSPAAGVRARIEAQVASRVWSELSVPTLPWPLSQERDVYGLTYSTPDEGTVSGVYLELGWTHICATGQPTTHRLTRIEATA